jgi:hypothetical protein
MGIRSARSLLTIVVSILVAILIITTLQQYTVYYHERRELSATIANVRKKIKMAEKHKPEKIFERLKKIDLQMSLSNQIMPSTMDAEAFLDYFSILANSLGVEVHDTHIVVSSKEFYIEAVLTMSLYGDKKAIRALIEKQIQKLRQTSWRLFRGADNKFPLELTIYSFKYPMKHRKGNELSIEKKLCLGFKSRVWMWPFKGIIKTMYQELEKMCHEVRGHSETLKLLEEGNRKVDQIETKLKVIKELEKHILLPSFEKQ